MKITSFATLAALAFTFNLSANHFELQEVLLDEGDVAFSLPLKIKTEQAIQEDLWNMGYQVETQVSFITVHNTTKQPVAFGGVKIPVGKKRLFCKAVDKHSICDAVPLESESPLLLSILPTALSPNPTLNSFKSWGIFGDACIKFVSAEDWFNKRISEKHGLIYKEYPYAVVMREVACDPNEWFKSVYEQNNSAIFIELGSDSELNSHRLQVQKEKQLQK